MGDIRTAKKQLRAAVRARRREVVQAQGPAGRAEHADALAEAFRGWVREYAAGQGRADPAGLTVTAFDPLPTEPPVDALVRAALAEGLRVLLPVTRREEHELHWVGADDPEAEPAGPEALLGVDIALIPGLSVDRQGHRLGQGGGYYDQFLPLVRPGVPVVVALHDHELVDHVPTEPHDIPVDAVLTTVGVTWLGA